MRRKPLRRLGFCDEQCLKGTEVFYDMLEWGLWVCEVKRSLCLVCMLQWHRMTKGIYIRGSKRVLKLDTRVLWLIYARHFTVIFLLQGLWIHLHDEACVQQSLHLGLRFFYLFLWYFIVRSQADRYLFWLWWVIDLARFEFEFGRVLFWFSFIFDSFGESCLLVSWCAGGRCGMACSDEECGRSRRHGAEDRGWSHR
jgi:hypothetical protein